MESRRRKTSRRPTPLTKAVLLQSVLATAAGHAGQPTDVTPANSASPQLAQLELDRLARLDVNSYQTSKTDGLDLYLDVTLNGKRSGLAHFNYHDGQLWASAKVLRELGFILPPDTRDPVPLNSLVDVEVDYQPRQQAVTIVAPLNMLDLDTTVINTNTNQRPQPTASPGVLLNYNLYGSQVEQGTKKLNAFSELRGFNSWGVLSSTALTTQTRSADFNGNGSSWERETVRLDTTFSTSFPDSLVTLRAGDVRTGALSWTRSTRLGGLQMGTDFSLQPYLATRPLPSFFGSATLPSKADLYINGIKQYSGEVSAGPFEITTPPSVNGAGNAELVLTDALGESTTVNFALYDNQRLLKPGLSDWSVEVGAVRENYGITSFDYGDDVAVSGTLRHGVNRLFTAEGHAEATDGLSNAGAGGTLALGSMGGTLSASLAGSQSDGEGGTQYSASYAWNNRRLSFNVSYTNANDDYRDVGTRFGPAPARQRTQVSTGYSTELLGGVGLSYNEVDYANQDTTQFASASWSKFIGRRLSVNLTYNQDIQNADNNSASLGVSLSLDRNISVSSNVQHTKDRTIFVAEANKTPLNEGGLGWRAQARHNHHNQGDNDTNGGLAELNYLGQYGRVAAGVRDNDGTQIAYASGTGSLVAMGGGVFAARQINSGFAVVSTNGVSDVPVLLENNRIGTTNNKGLLLVTPLNSYQNNKISIDPMNLPADRRIDPVSLEATPTDRAGTMVDFEIARTQAASVILKDDKGDLIPMGSRVRLTSASEASPTIVGFDGEVYLEMLDERNELEVTTPAGEVCQVRFGYQKQGDGIPLIGPFTCHKVQTQ